MLALAPLRPHSEPSRLAHRPFLTLLQDMLFLMYPEKSSKDIATMELETRPPPPVVEETVDPVKEEARSHANRTMREI